MLKRTAVAVAGIALVSVAAISGILLMGDRAAAGAEDEVKILRVSNYNDNHWGTGH